MAMVPYGDSSESPPGSLASDGSATSATPPSSPRTGATNSNDNNDNAAVADRRPQKKKKKSNRRSQRESFVLICVILFVLNSLNGQKVIQGVNSQFDELSKMVHYSPPVADGCGGGRGRNETTAIIITSSWIPSHPSTYIIETVLNSTMEHLVGLSPTAPVFITVDHFRFSDYSNLPPALEKRVNELDEYMFNLENRYLSDPRVHVVPSAKQHHIGGSVMRALNLIGRHHPAVRYVYSLQHDFQFDKDVDHLGLVGAMDRHPNKTNYVRFMKPSPLLISKRCYDEKPILWNETAVYRARARPDNDTVVAHELVPTGSYSDNNHLVRFGWYRDVIASLKMLTRSPEGPLQLRANQGCGRRNGSMGLYLYHETNLRHLDGRRARPG
mmetsp:Transcript_54101/g.114919  ORF Transcript_54101/g.114919 Transcript_54101/m.114919 type:complete len:384 (+) Transcript_54101:102-1253(+)